MVWPKDLEITWYRSLLFFFFVESFFKIMLWIYVLCFENLIGTFQASSFTGGKRMAVSQFL